MNASHSRGFGLIEIMVVTSIIGVLASIGAVAGKEFKNRAKNAKVQAETTQVRTNLESYAAEYGGFPNPDPGQRRLYCVGSDRCAYKGKEVNDRLNVEEMPEFEDLALFDSGDGWDTGYLYMSCGDEDIVYCDPEDTALLYGTTDDEWVDPFGNFDAFWEDDFDWGDWGWDDIDWDSYSDYDEEEGDQGGSGSYVAQCLYPDYASGTFEIYPSFTTNQPIMSSPSCDWNGTMGYYECTLQCQDALTEFVNMVNGAYPYPYCGQTRRQHGDPCVDYLGETFCNVDC